MLEPSHARCAGAIGRLARCRMAALASLSWARRVASLQFTEGTPQVSAAAARWSAAAEPDLSTNRSQGGAVSRRWRFVSAWTSSISAPVFRSSGIRRWVTEPRCPGGCGRSMNPMRSPSARYSCWDPHDRHHPPAASLPDDDIRLDPGQRVLGDERPGLRDARVGGEVVDLYHVRAVLRHRHVHAPQLEPACPPAGQRDVAKLGGDFDHLDAFGSHESRRPWLQEVNRRRFADDPDLAPYTVQLEIPPLGLQILLSQVQGLGPPKIG